MSPRRPARSTTVAGTLVALLVAAGCGQVSVGEDAPVRAPGATVSPSPGAPSAADDAGAGDGALTDLTAPAAPTTPATLVPGPGAPAGCADLVMPLYGLVTGEGDPVATAEQVRRLADGAGDNALSAVARRLSALSTQPVRDLLAISAEWDQVQEICRLP